MIKKLILLQIILLVCTATFGLLLKNNFEAIRMFHPLFGVSAGIVAVIATVMLFKQKQTIFIKTLSFLTVLFIVSAALGGSALARTMDYQLSYNQMIVSAVLALLTSIILFFKVKKLK